MTANNNNNINDLKAQIEALKLQKELNALQAEVATPEATPVVEAVTPVAPIAPVTHTLKTGDYVKAVLGGLLGGFPGMIAAPFVLKAVNGSWKKWALIGIAAAPLCSVLQTAVLFGGSGSTTTSTRSAYVAPAPAPAPVTESVTLAGIRFDDVKATKTPTNEAGRYRISLTGVPTNTTNEELTWAESVGASVGACMFANFEDQADRKFDASCNLPNLLPGQTGARAEFAHSSAVADTKSVDFKVSAFNNQGTFRF